MLVKRLLAKNARKTALAKRSVSLASGGGLRDLHPIKIPISRPASAGAIRLVQPEKSSSFV
jgi:hypothetical protein